VRVTVRRSGGFAGRVMERSVDSGDDPQLEPLVAAARAAGNASSDVAPDAFRYEITIDGETVVVSDDAEAWMRVVERIL
jgi:hypothetical protein